MRSLSDPHHDPVYGCLYRQPRPYYRGCKLFNFVTQFWFLCRPPTFSVSWAALPAPQDPTTPSTEAPTSEAALSTGEATEPNAIPADGSELGEGQHSFTFQVQMADGTAYHYTVHTDEETVGAALVDLGLIEGEEGSYGLYVTTVLGTTLDYDADGYWWALSENGTDASVGVDSLPVNDGSTYAFTATKA